MRSDGAPVLTAAYDDQNRVAGGKRMTSSADVVTAHAVAEHLASARSFLFVPGDRPERFAKAHASGADVVILDLEDAVAPERKTLAREAVAGWLAEGHHAVVRVNATSSLYHAADLDVVGAALAIMVAKAENPADCAPLGRPAIPLIETARGLAAAADFEYV